MPISSWKSCSAAAAIILVVALLLSAAPRTPNVPSDSSSSNEVQLILDPVHSNLDWTLETSLHTVHGTFNLKSGVLRFDPATGKASGEIIVIATSGDSKNNSRDQKMHKEILESGKYPDVIFYPQQLEGKVASSGNSDVSLRGKISLHGAEHELTVPIHAEFTGGHWKATTKFEIPYIQWGLKDPSNWLLKAKPNVKLDLSLTGSATFSNQNN